MKKLLVVLLILLALGLSACEQDDYIVDCDRFPTHADCLTDTDPDPTVCEDGYVLEDETCVPDDDTPTSCEDGYVLEDGNCVVEEPDSVTCSTGYLLVGEECVFDNDSLGDYLDIYYLNDFHGALERDNENIGISYIANLVKTRKTESPDNVLFLAGGDMLQGSALSNYFDGLSTITLLNESQLDAFTVGNHEFDWGIETILQYADDDITNGEADFPFLGANIFQDLDDAIPNGIDPYTIIEKGDHTIGIIGTMGSGLEYSIAESKIADYYFGDPLTEIATYAEELRTTHNCDIVIVVAHDSGSSLNNAVGNLTGNQRVDAIFNGHSHSQYTTTANGVPVMQSGSTGQYVGHLRLYIGDDGSISNFTATNLRRNNNPLLNSPDSSVQTILDLYLEETDPIFNTPIFESLADYSKYDLSDWLASLIRVSMDADIAFHNYGGTRTDLDRNEVITLGKLYQIWPFDNVIKTVELDGSIINGLLNDGMAVSTEITTFEAGTLYLVATNDYVFDKTSNPFISGVNPFNTGVVLRDLVEVELTAQADIYDGFLDTNEFQTVPLDVEPVAFYQKEENISSFLLFSYIPILQSWNLFHIIHYPLGTDTAMV